MEKIMMTTVGVIHSPYKQVKDIPIQGKFKPDITAYVELKDQYAAGLRDLDGFSHAIIIYYFHKSQKENVIGKPFLEDKEHGIFAIRSPHRPNHIGLSVVKIEKIQDNKLYFSEVDVLDQTPLLDIKPYVKHFDIRDNVVSGWLDKHFKGGSNPVFHSRGSGNQKKPSRS
jgi:tRNA-Thr(GGU) m(6)t(6)A37 methyltransferase TsaA